MDNAIYEKILSLNQQLLQQQNNIATITLLGVSIITVMLIGATWLWNFVIARRDIKGEINRHYMQINKEIDKAIESKVKDIESSVKQVLKNDLLCHEGDIHRLFAISCERAEFFDMAAHRWASTLGPFEKTDNQRLLRTATENILHNIKREKALEKTDRKDIEDIIKKVKAHVPNILEEEKNEIINILEKYLNTKTV